MGHLLLIQVQLFLLKKLKTASDQQKNLYHNTFWTFCASWYLWTPGKASCKKTNSLATSEPSRSLTLDIVRPAIENTHFDGADVAGMLNNCS